MLFLLKNNNTGVVFYLMNGNEYIVGRKDCNILIGDDPSISRRHARLLVKGDHVTLEDLGSKYKTTHKGKGLPPNTEIQLESNDKIHFGVMTSQFTFQQHKIVTTGTRLNSSQKAKLKQDLTILGAQFIDQWTANCTHLTVEEITLTVKVLQALVDEKPIVLPSYWTKYRECVQKNTPPPNIQDFNNPPMAEALLNKVEITRNIPRKGLFKGKNFIFPKEAMKQQMGDIIKKLGGSAISWEQNPLPLEDIANSTKEFLVIQMPDQSEDTSLNEVIKILSKKGKRTIPLQEIAMAVVLASCEKDCNPNFNRAAEVFQAARPREPTQNNGLVPNTETEQFDAVACKLTSETKNVIDETLENNWDMPPIKIERKRTRAETVAQEYVGVSNRKAGNNEPIENPSKKTKIERDETISLVGNKEFVNRKQTNQFIAKPILGKRKAEDDSSLPMNSGDKPNPFAMIMKKSKKEPESTIKNVNPFNVLKKSSENVLQVSNENPFKQSSKKSADTITQRDTTVEDKSPEKTVNYSRISKTDSSNMNSTWFSKKASFEVENKEEDDYDMEMKSFIESFRNKVVVGVLASISIRHTTVKDNVDSVTSGGTNNFKKFKKIMPLHPQNTIIGKDNFVEVTPGDVTGINDTRRKYHDSDDESRTRINKRKPPKKFYF